MVSNRFSETSSMASQLSPSREFSIMSAASVTTSCPRAWQAFSKICIFFLSMRYVGCFNDLKSGMSFNSAVSMPRNCREDGEDHFFHTIAIRHTQHVRLKGPELKGPEPRWSDIIMTMKEKQTKGQQANTFCAHSKTLETLRGFHTPRCAGTCDEACVQKKINSDHSFRRVNVSSLATETFTKLTSEDKKIRSK